MLKRFNKEIIAGCDEAGRGSLAGPVVAAAVILPKKFKNNLINDSKSLTEKQRNTLFPIIKAEAISYSFGIVSEKKIDEINILNASLLAMHKSIRSLNIIPELLLIDGNIFRKYKDIPHKCIIKGDAKFISIAAASILAKVYRDKIMSELHLEIKDYNWKKNKGYPTKEHRLHIKRIGASKYHRKSFQLLQNSKN